MVSNSSLQRPQSHCPQWCCRLYHNIRGFWWSVLAWTIIWEVREWLQHVLPVSVPPKFRSWGPISKCDSSGPQQSLFVWTAWPIFSASLKPIKCSRVSVLASLGYRIYCCLYRGRFQAQLEGRVTATWPALWPAAPNLLRSDSCWLIPHLNKLLTALEFLEQLTALSRLTLPC